jgi:hypothetical protein
MGGNFGKESLRLELISIFEEYINKFSHIGESLKERSRKIYSKSPGAGIILGDPFEEALDAIESIGWDFPEINSSELCKPSVEEAKKILSSLEKA